MKKIISLIISCMMLCSFMVPAVNAEYVEGQVELSEADNAALKSKIDAAFPGDTINISYIGGSITFGDGSKGGYENSWASLVTAKFTELCPDKTVTGNNVGISDTMAEFGKYRFKKLIADRDPDLVFIEFSINDRNGGDEHLEKQYEGMIQTLLELDKVPYVVFVYAGSRPNAYRYAKADDLAEYYGVQTMDLYSGVYYELVPEMIAKYETPEGYWTNAEGVDAYIRDYMSRGNATSGEVKYLSAAEYIAAVTDKEVADENYNKAQGHKKTDVYAKKSDMYGSAFDAWSEEEAAAWNSTDIFWFNTILSDNVHPNNAGYYRYAREMFEKFTAEGFKKPASGKELYYSDTVVNADLIPASLAKLTGFTESDTIFFAGEDYKPFIAAEPGATAEFNFYGDSIGLVGLRNKTKPNGVEVDFVIDEGTDNEVTGKFSNYCASNNSKPFMMKPIETGEEKYRGRVVFTSDKLSKGWHTIKLTTPAECSADNTFILAYFAMSRTYETPEIDAIYVNGEELEMENAQAVSDNVSESIAIEFDGYPDYNTVNEESVFLKINGVITDYEGSLDGNIYTLTNFGEIAPEAIYEITVTDAVTYAGQGARTGVRIVPSTGYILSGLRFKTINDTYITSAADIAGGVKTSVNVISTKTQDDILLITVQKDADGNIKAVKTDGKKSASDGVTLTADLVFESVSAGDSVEAFIWVQNTLMPLTDKIIFSTDTLGLTAGDEELLAFTVSEVKKSEKITTVESVRSDEGIITVSGTSEGNTVSVRIVNSDGENTYFGQAECVDGVYSIDCKSQEITDDSFIVYVSCN